MRVQWIIVALVGAQSLLACDSTESGVIPVGGEQISPTEVERFVRRAHLDMLGTAATDEFVTSKAGELVAAGNTAAARGDFVGDLLADPSWATATVDELENRAFAGDGYDFAYALLCNNSRQTDPACAGCSASADPCTSCTCPAVVAFLDERTSLESAEGDLAAGTATVGEIERRFADSDGYQFGQAIQTLADNLFRNFLGRAAEADELANATALIVGFVAAPNNAAGLLFHRHGSNYADLIDIIFKSELYREAVVTRVFDRLLGRIATPAEIAHFAADLDSDALDPRALLTAVVSSTEYFNQ